MQIKNKNCERQKMFTPTILSHVTYHVLCQWWLDLHQLILIEKVQVDLCL